MVAVTGILFKARVCDEEIGKREIRSVISRKPLPTVYIFIQYIACYVFGSFTLFLVRIKSVGFDSSFHLFNLVTHTSIIAQTMYFKP